MKLSRDGEEVNLEELKRGVKSDYNHNILYGI